MPPNQDEFHLEILAGPGAATQTVFGDVDASLSVKRTRVAGLGRGAARGPASGQP